MFEINSCEIDAVDIHDNNETIHVYLNITVDENFYTENNLDKDLDKDEWGVCVDYEKEDDTVSYEFTNDSNYLDMILSEDECEIVSHYLEENKIIETIKNSKPEDGISFADLLAINMLNK